MENQGNGNHVEIETEEIPDEFQCCVCLYVLIFARLIRAFNMHIHAIDVDVVVFVCVSLIWCDCFDFPGSFCISLLW